ncbi:MAG: hypothetical protein IPJ85_12440 [Flavobacteriales bacterium]|nr:hypothetical protein [Flavobacteriales bacterium]
MLPIVKPFNGASTFPVKALAQAMMLKAPQLPEYASINAPNSTLFGNTPMVISVCVAMKEYHTSSLAFAPRPQPSGSDSEAQEGENCTGAHWVVGVSDRPCAFVVGRLVRASHLP